MKLSRNVALSVLLASLLALAAGGAHAQLWGTTYQFYPSPGYYNGSTIYFLMTDVSNAAYATTFRTSLGFNINYTPLLANALDPALRNFFDQNTKTTVTLEFMPSLYFVTNPRLDLPQPQLLVFSKEWPVPPTPGILPPPPRPTPPFPTLHVGEYMPLWRLQLVTWNDPTNIAAKTVLKSESDITSRIGPVTDPTKLSVTDAGVVVGASILINSLGNKIPQAFVMNYAGLKLVRLPIRQIYVGGLVYKIIQLDFSNIYAVRTNKGTYSPGLDKFNLSRILGRPLASQIIYSFFPWPPVRQLYLGTQVPTPFGPSNTNANYSPLMNEWTVRLIGTPPPLPVFTDATNPAFLLKPRTPTNYMAFQPVVGR